MMTPFAHILGLPVEELALPLASSGGALWIAARTWLLGGRHVRDGCQDPDPEGEHR